MKKQLLLAMLSMLIFIACSKDDDANNDEDKKYLSEIRVTEHKVQFGSPSQSGELYESYKYNNKGKLVQKTTNYYHGGLDGRILNEYKYSYDERGKLIEYAEYQFTLLESKQIYSYNSIDSISEMKKYNEDGDLIEVWSYEYNADNKLNKIIEKDVWVSSNYGYEHYYIYEANKIKKTSYSLQDGNLFGTMIYEFDNEGNLTRETWINGEDNRSTIQKNIEYEYNSKGQITKKSSSGILRDDITYLEYTYNDDGSISKINKSYSYKTEESVLIYEYIYTK